MPLSNKPTPGGDAGNWGTKLNQALDDFVDVQLPATYAAIDRGMVTLADLPPVAYAAHRGGSNIAPEETPEAYGLATSLAFPRGIPIVELDVWGSSDEVPFVIHDDTVDRVTTSSGSVSSFTAAQLRAQTVDPVTFNGDTGWPNTGLLELESLFRRHAGRVVFMVEVKDTRSSVIDAVIALMRKYGVTESCIASSYTLASLAPFVTAGVAAMFNNDGFAQTPAALLAAGVTYMGASAYVTTNAQITEAITAGLKVCVYTVERQTTAAAYAALGCSIILGAEPLYVQGSPYTYRRATDSFKTGRFGHGYLDGRGDRRSVSSGARLNNAGELVLEGTGSLEPTVLLGELSPVPQPAESYSLSATIRLVTASTWAGIAFACPDDRSFKTGGTTGYLLLLRSTGSMELYRVIDTSSVNLGTVSTAAIAAGGTARVRIDVTPTQITVTRTDVSPTVALGPIADTTYRGGYLHGSKQNAGTEVRFSNIAVT